MPLLFSYGTLQQEAVQVSTFGRLLEGQPDELIGFEQTVLTIEDPEFVAASGKADHAIVRFNGRQDSRVSRYGVQGVRRRARACRRVRACWLHARLCTACVREGRVGVLRRSITPASRP
jgi:hypothetical protein